MNIELLFPDLSYSIVGCAFRVHNKLGGGLPEKSYQRALAVEFQDRSILFSEQLFSNTEYNKRKIHRNYSDFLLEDKIIVELKSEKRIVRADFKQIKKDLKATDKKLGLPLNFGPEELTFERVLNIY